jgi:hypothetical protein
MPYNSLRVFHNLVISHRTLFTRPIQYIDEAPAPVETAKNDVSTVSSI